MATGAQRVRRPALDGMRGVAVLAVLGFHAWRRALPGGAVGVDVFFVLSGFLITGLLIDEHARTGVVSFRSFYVRRVRRLLPALLCVIVAGDLYALTQTGAARAHVLTGSATALTFSSDWVEATHGPGSLGLFGSTWSLAVEEQFYILWPVLLIPLVRLRGPRAVALVAGLAAATAVVVRAAAMARGMPFDRAYYSADLHADPILIGCCLAGLRSMGLRLPRALADAAGGVGLVMLGVLAVAPAVVPPAPFGFTAGALAGAALIVASLDGRLVARLLSWRWLVAAGVVSYGIYLWTAVVAVAVERLGVAGGYAHLAAVTCGSLAVAAVSWRYVEAPVLRRRGPARAVAGGAGERVAVATAS